MGRIAWAYNLSIEETGGLPKNFEFQVSLTYRMHAVLKEGGLAFNASTQMLVTLYESESSLTTRLLKATQ